MMVNSELCSIFIVLNIVLFSSYLALLFGMIHVPYFAKLNGSLKYFGVSNNQTTRLLLVSINRTEFALYFAFGVNP